jgi:hypothetical protein
VTASPRPVGSASILETICYKSKTGVGQSPLCHDGR